MVKQGLYLNGGSRTELSQQDRLAYDQGRTKVAQDNCHQKFGQAVTIQVVTAWAHCFYHATQMPCVMKVFRKVPAHWIVNIPETIRV
jgi:hypothetical protein